MIASNADKCALTIEVAAQRVPDRVVEALKDNAKLIFQKSKQFTQRRFHSLEDLRKMGHPYAKRHPHPPIQPHIINRQTGNLHRNWRWNWSRTPDGAVATVFNNAFNAPFMRDERGTLTMIARPVRAEAIRRTKSFREANMRKALRGGF